MSDFFEMAELLRERQKYWVNNHAAYYIKKSQQAYTYLNDRVGREYKHYADYAMGYAPPNYPMPSLLGEATIQKGYVAIYDANDPTWPDVEWISPELRVRWGLDR